MVEGPCAYFPEGGCGFANPVFPGVAKGNTFRSGNYQPCKFTYIDKTGRIITPQRFDFARDFSEGLAPVRIGEAWGFIDKTGTVAIAPKFENAERFSSGLSKVLMNGSYGFIDKIATWGDGLFAVTGDGRTQEIANQPVRGIAPDDP